ncbi:LuxR C-terminal-related transcriptional regulator [Rhodococcus erythropolis]|uniref:ATP-binding protein n=1 Tax=Rhodococcus erythropolis TaxID=1833 RepID=UPI0029497063|nr:LuxR C-terminal-related transcriptional regulator [Rhodococcus erythropolis]MDV6212698.1 LuxR C-terminal-related transcriptional regulator [Rhodococcus erythropolis]
MLDTDSSADVPDASNKARTSLTSFVGRRQELADTKKRLTQSRLVTLVGPGGVGKTRVAIETAERSRRALRDGVYVVDLASSSDPSVVSQEIVSALELPDMSNRDPLSKLVTYLSGRHTMIVLDNCEHVLTECARIVEVLLGCAPGLRILATSREPLGLRGEAVCVIPPLTTPSPNETHSTKSVTRYEAVNLLIDRARYVLPDFDVTDGNVDAVVKLCEQLDGIPLAIELAATRLRSLSVTQIVDRLSRRFSLLTGGDTVALPRQRTLRALVDWSFDLCTHEEQYLWARLSVFPGSFELEAVEKVCGFAPLIEDSVMDLIDRLVAKSIVYTERAGERVRYRQLMTLREYGAEVFLRFDERSVLAERHRDYFYRQAATMVAEWCGPGQADALSMMKEDHANVLSALEWSAANDNGCGTAVEFAASLRYHWVAGGYLSDGRRWLDHLLDCCVMPEKQRGEALWVSGWIALMQGDRDTARKKLIECQAVADRLDDRGLGAHASEWLGLHAFSTGDVNGSIAYYEAALAIFLDLDDIASVLTTLFQLASAQAYNSQHEAALQTCRRVIGVCEEFDEQWNRSYALWIAGLCYWKHGDLVSAKASALQALRLEGRFKDSICSALTIELLSWVAVAESDYQTAAALASAASAVWSGLGTDVAAFGLHLHDDSVRAASETSKHVGTRFLDEMQRRNVNLTQDEAVALALGRTSRRPTSDASTASPLTKREIEVASHVAKGLSNRAIAEALVLSTRTIDGHVERILTKLDFTSRAQIAAYIASRPALH